MTTWVCTTRQQESLWFRRRVKMFLVLTGQRWMLWTKFNSIISTWLTLAEHTSEVISHDKSDHTSEGCYWYFCYPPICACKKPQRSRFSWIKKKQQNCRRFSFKRPEGKHGKSTYILYLSRSRNTSIQKNTIQSKNALVKIESKKLISSSSSSSVSVQS